MVFYRECCLFYMVWWLLSRQIAWTSSKWIFKSFDVVTKIFIICKRVVWMFVNNDMNLLQIWLALLIRLQKSCLIIVNTRENIFKQQISMLITLKIHKWIFYFADVYRCKEVQSFCLWCWSYRRRYISCKWFD